MATQSRLTTKELALVFIGLLAGLLLAALDQTVVATALPTIVGELGGLDHYSWVVTAYLLSSTVTTPLYGKISDLYGRRIVFRAAIVIFLIGSLLAGVAQDMLQLILFRGIQGAGAGGLMAMAFAIVGDVLSPRERGRYMGFLGAAFAFASVVGPLVGGFIVDNASWRWVFLINLPVGVAALAITSTALKHLTINRRSHRIDWQGAALLVGGATSLLLVLVWGGVEYPWTSDVVIGLGITGVLLTASFVFWEGKAAEPILPLRLFRTSIFTVTSIIGFMIGCAMFGGVVFLPLFLQVVMQASATDSGLLLLPFMAGIMTASVGSGRMISHTGRYRSFPIAGTAIATVGAYLLSTMDATTGRTTSSIYMLIFGLGLGMTIQVLVLAVQNAVPHHDLGVATSAATFFRSMGGSFGVALYGAILNYRLSVELPALLPASALAGVGANVSSLMSSPAAIRSMPPAVRNGIIEALTRGLHSVFFWTLPLLVVAFVVSWWLEELPLRETAHVDLGLIEGAGEELALHPES
ncbi:MAG: MDR family MFS transporter [Vicinamibacterales bacterium]